MTFVFKYALQFFTEKDILKIRTFRRNFNPPFYCEAMSEGLIRVVRADISQFDGEFMERHQCAAITIAALAYAEDHPLSPTRMWTPEILNELIRVGNRVYGYSRYAKNLPPGQYMELSNVIGRFAIFNREYRVTAYDGDLPLDLPLSKHSINSTLTVNNLVGAFHQFFGSDNKGGFCDGAHWMSFYISEDRNTFYLFDSAFENERNYNDYIGVLIEFSELRDMAELIYRKVNNIPQSTKIFEDEEEEGNGWNIWFGLYRVEVEHQLMKSGCDVITKCN